VAIVFFCKKRKTKQVTKEPTELHTMDETAANVTQDKLNESKVNLP
jgi:hypothetical protein